MSIDRDTARHLHSTSGRHIVNAPREVLNDPRGALPSVVLVDGPPALWVVPTALSGLPLHHFDDETLEDMLDEAAHAYAMSDKVGASIAR